MHRRGETGTVADVVVSRRLAGQISCSRTRTWARKAVEGDDGGRVGDIRSPKRHDHGGRLVICSERGQAGAHGRLSAFSAPGRVGSSHHAVLLRSGRGRTGPAVRRRAGREPSLTRFLMRRRGEAVTGAALGRHDSGVISFACDNAQTRRQNRPSELCIGQLGRFFVWAPGLGAGQGMPWLYPPARPPCASAHTSDAGPCLWSTASDGASEVECPALTDCHASADWSTACRCQTVVSSVLWRRMHHPFLPGDPEIEGEEEDGSEDRFVA